MSETYILIVRYKMALTEAKCEERYIYFGKIEGLRIKAKSLDAFYKSLTKQHEIIGYTMMIEQVTQTYKLETKKILGKEVAK